MRVFVDSSALIALVDESDIRHREAARIWTRLIESDVDLLTHSYIVVESIAVVQRRLGDKSLVPLLDGLLPPIGVVWVDEKTHRQGLGAFRTAGRRELSLVDCVSFEVMRHGGCGTAFAFDRHFTEQGFTLLKA